MSAIDKESLNGPINNKQYTQFEAKYSSLSNMKESFVRGR
jgi:hypothetical protein